MCVYVWCMCVRLERDSAPLCHTAQHGPRPDPTNQPTRQTASGGRDCCSAEGVTHHEGSTDPLYGYCIALGIHATNKRKAEAGAWTPCAGALAESVAFARSALFFVRGRIHPVTHKPKWLRRVAGQHSQAEGVRRRRIPSCRYKTGPRLDTYR